MIRSLNICTAPILRYNETTVSSASSWDPRDPPFRRARRSARPGELRSAPPRFPAARAPPRCAPGGAAVSNEDPSPGVPTGIVSGPSTSLGMSAERLMRQRHHTDAPPDHRTWSILLISTWWAGRALELGHRPLWSRPKRCQGRQNHDAFGVMRDA